MLKVIVEVVVSEAVTLVVVGKLALGAEKLKLTDGNALPVTEYFTLMFAGAPLIGWGASAVRAHIERHSLGVVTGTQKLRRDKGDCEGASHLRTDWKC